MKAGSNLGSANGWAVHGWLYRLAGMEYGVRRRGPRGLPRKRSAADRSAATALCDSRRAFLLIDAPPNVNTVSAAVDWKTSQLAVNDANGAEFFPRPRLPHPLNNFQLRTFAPCGVVTGLYARIDSARGVLEAPAGTDETLAGEQSLFYKLTDGENGMLSPLGLNCFRTFPVYGSILWRARTLVGADAETSQWKYVPVRRTALTPRRASPAAPNGWSSRSQGRTKE